MTSYLSRASKICLTLAALMFLAVSVVDAQPPERGRGQRGRGGFGGFRGGPPNIFGLTANPDVQKELQLTADQTEKAKKIQDAHRQEARGGRRRGGFGEGFRDLSEEEGNKRIAEFRKQRAETEKKLNAKYRPQLAAVLTSEQMTRLDQIRLQAAGPEVLNDPEVGKALGITSEQRDKFAAVRDESRAKMREMFRGGGREGMREKMQEMRKESQAATLKILSDDQRAKFASMKGKPFEGAERLGRQRGGRRGGRGGPGGDRPRRRPATE